MKDTTFTTVGGAEYTLTTGYDSGGARVHHGDMHVEVDGIQVTDWDHSNRYSTVWFQHHGGSPTHLDVSPATARRLEVECGRDVDGFLAD